MDRVAAPASGTKEQECCKRERAGRKGGMKKFKLTPAMRSFFAFSATVIWLGIWLTGFKTVHWLLYMPAVLFTFAVLTGICPGMIFFKTIFREK